MQAVKKDTNVLCFLSLLGPSCQDETGAARLQWRQREKKVNAIVLHTL